MNVTTALQLIGTTSDVALSESENHWRNVFGGIWGALDIRSVHDGQISGSLHSRTVGDLTFNRIEFGNQQFERTRSQLKELDAPFFSLSFPEAGSAICQIGDTVAQLKPQNAYLLNNGLSAKLKVEHNYSTFNLKIPAAELEHRLGRKTDILTRGIIQPDAICHMMQRLIAELLENVESLDEKTVGFMTNQMLDTVAFFLTSGGGMSEDSLAQNAVRARVLAFLDANYHVTTLTPQKIAQACGISRSYLYKVFSREPSVMSLLKDRRLEAARGMIEWRTTPLTMTEVAMACGFSSSSEFSRQFRNEFGIAPSKM